MNFRVSVEINAPAEIVWRVLCDIERWPEWTASVTSVGQLETGPFRVGSRARIVQPKLLPATWRVTELEENRNFTWIAASPGVRTTAGHLLGPQGPGTRVTLSINFAGLLSGLVGRLARSLTERYMQMEANGLKARSEQLAAASASPAKN